MRFSNDIFVIAENKNKLQEMLDRLNKAGKWDSP